MPAITPAEILSCSKFTLAAITTVKHKERENLPLTGTYIKVDVLSAFQ